MCADDVGDRSLGLGGWSFCCTFSCARGGECRLRFFSTRGLILSLPARCRRKRGEKQVQATFCVKRGWNRGGSLLENILVVQRCFHPQRRAFVVREHAYRGCPPRPFFPRELNSTTAINQALPPAPPSPLAGGGKKRHNMHSSYRQASVRGPWRNERDFNLSGRAGYSHEFTAPNLRGPPGLVAVLVAVAIWAE